MKRQSFLARTQQTGVIWCGNEHMVQVARLVPLEERPLLVDALAELSPADDAALLKWIDDTCGDRTSTYVPGYCGFHPAERVLQRKAINPRKLDEPEYLSGLAAEAAKVAAVNDWQICAVDPTDGGFATTDTGLMIGVPRASARELQRKLCRWKIRPRRLELATLPLLGTLTRNFRANASGGALAVCEIGRTQTQVYFIGKDGIHTPAPLPHGLLSIEETAMKELSAPDLASTRAQLARATPELRAHGRRFVRVLTRHLRPAIDYFEMQTGQAISALFAGSLPSGLGWIEEALAPAVELTMLTPDFDAWLAPMGLQLAPGTPTPARSWLQPLSLAAEFAATP